MKQTPCGEVREAKGQATWKQMAPRYRLLLFGKGEAPDESLATTASASAAGKARRGISRERALREVARGGKLSLPEVLRCRVRYFCDGAVLGSAAFVNDLFEKQRWRFGERRPTGARKMRGAHWGELRTLRDLRVEAVA